MSSTTIDISVNTKNLLLQFERDGESYGHIIERLIEEAGWKELDAHLKKMSLFYLMIFKRGKGHHAMC